MSRIRWPFVTRKRLDAALDEAQVTRYEVDQHRRTLARMGHNVLRIKREHAKLLSDMRLIRSHIEYPGPNSDLVRFGFEMRGDVFDSFRHDRNFVDLVAYMVEEAMMKSPEGRSLLGGYYSSGPKTPRSTV